MSTPTKQPPAANGYPQRLRGSNAKAVGSFVPRLTRTAMQKYGFSAAALLTDWASIVGRDLATYTDPVRLKWPRQVDAYGDADAEAAGRPGATLILRVDGARALDVQYKGAQIIERINSYFGYRAIAELRLMQAPVDKSAAGAPPEPPRQTLPRDVIAGKPAAPRAPVDLTQIPDENLRAALEKLQRSMSKG